MNTSHAEGYRFSDFYGVRPVFRKDASNLPKDHSLVEKNSIVKVLNSVCSNRFLDSDHLDELYSISQFPDSKLSVQNFSTSLSNARWFSRSSRPHTELRESEFLHILTQALRFSILPHCYSALCSRVFRNQNPELCDLICHLIDI